jgi:hypothetical protein
MKERPILFSGPMVRALLDGSKTQTRRIVKPQPWDSARSAHYGPSHPSGSGGMHPASVIFSERETFDPPWAAPMPIVCPFGEPGDRLWVREAWRSVTDLDKSSGSGIAELCTNAGYRTPWAPLQYEADRRRVNWEHTSTPPHDGEPLPGRYRHARFMPRWASRITLEVTGVRVERLQSITEADARHEGAVHSALLPMGWNKPGCDPQDGAMRSRFAALWDSLAAPGADWDANPWVWVVEFKRVT